MKRDFSDASKQKMLALVAQVESEKWGDFTDWLGDRWYDFESWIGMLDIKRYIDDVNVYHKKVIDKNNATEQTINSIFAAVRDADTSFSGLFRDIHTQLSRWLRYIDLLSDIVSPQNGNFTGNYMERALSGILTEISTSSEMKLPTHTGAVKCNGPARAKEFFKFISSIVGAAGKIGNSNEASLGKSILSYLSTVCGVASTGCDTETDVTSEMLSLLKSSGKTWTDLYKYYEKTLNPYEASKLADRFSPTATNVSIGSSIAGLINEGVKTYRSFVDSESTAYDDAAQALKLLGATGEFGGNAYIASQASTKTLQFVSSFDGSKTAVNQILATDQTLKYTTSKTVTKKISNAQAGIAVGNVVISTVSGGVKRYGEVSEDGSVDVQDAASIGLYSSLSGLDTVANSLTFGIVDFDSEGVAADLESDADEFVQGESWAAQYIRDTENNIVLRFGVSVGSAAYIVGENVIEGVSNGADAVASWVSGKWNDFMGLF